MEARHDWNLNPDSHGCEPSAPSLGYPANLSYFDYYGQPSIQGNN